MRNLTQLGIGGALFIQALLEFLVIALLIGVVVGLWTARTGPRFDSFIKFSEAAFHTSAAIGLVLAGAWVFFQQDWAPKVSVELKTDKALLEQVGVRTVLVQMTIGVKNEGRIPYDFSNYQMSVRGYSPGASDPNGEGDVARLPLGDVVVDRNVHLMPGETDYVSGEFRVPCTEMVVQVLAKVDHPDHDLSYERKALVVLSDLCTAPSMAAKRT